MNTNHAESIERAGFCVVPDLVSEGLRRELAQVFEACREGAGRRNGFDFEAVGVAAGSEGVVALVRSILGEGAFAVKATLFDKTRACNWLVPWHQDVMIPVQERLEVPGFDAWSIKNGIAHVRPPEQVLESMVAVRIDLDGSTPSNGALRVIPGTHNRGLLGAGAVQEIQTLEDPVECLVPVGGGLVMRPLLLHASSRACEPVNRRIVHLEYSARQLPGGLDWFHQQPV